LVIDLQPDWRVLAFVGGVGFLAAAFFGLAPALLATRANPNDILKGTAAGVTGGFGRARAGKVVVGAQIALSAILLTAASWFAFTLRNLERLDLGYSREQLLLVLVDPLSAGYHGPQLASVYQDLQHRFERIPGVRAVAWSDNGLFSGRESADEITVEGYPPPQRGEKPHSGWDQVGPAYFSILGVPLLKGREIAPSDFQGTPRVCVINRAFAEKFFPHADPIGKHVTDEYPDTHFTFEIVGVTGDVHDHSLRERVEPRFYIPALQPMLKDEYTDSMNYEIRTFASPASVVEAARKQIAGLNPDIRINFVRTMQETIAAETLRDRMLARLALASSALALLITCFGLYAILSYSVTRRMGEIGVRIALGADPAHIARSVVGEALRVAAIGLCTGIPLALVLSTLIRSQLFGLTASDPLSLSIVALALLLTSAVAALAPARRAAAMDPIHALRRE
jgi:predicted permease